MEKHRGFTLIELMVVILIAGVLLGVGVPSFQRMLRNNQRASSTNEIIAAINGARSEAVKRNTRVSLCPSTSGTACTGGSNWEAGWISFVDDDFDDVADASDDNGSWDTGEEILTIASSVEGTTVRSTFTWVTYRPNGRMKTSAAAEQAEFILCDDRGVADASAILIWISGRPQASDTTLANVAPTTCTPS